MSRVDIYCKMTDAGNLSCSLFEEVLEHIYDQYDSIYNALMDNNVIENIADISCNTEENTFNVNITLKTYSNLEELSVNIRKDVKRALCKSHKVDVSISNMDSLLIKIIKGRWNKYENVFSWHRNIF